MITSLCLLCSIFLLTGCSGSKMLVTEHLENHYNENVYENRLHAQELCVSAEDVTLEGLEGDEDLHAAGLFDLKGQEVLYADSIHEKLYPASITKIMTALLAIENGNLDDEVTISSTAAASAFPIYAQVLGLREGEVWTLRDLLYGVLLYSGNDTASAVAEYVGTTQEGFVEMMNTRSQELLANNTHFTNPHGLHDPEHYTTAYDVYLIFNECLKHQEFVDIIKTSSYEATYRTQNGTEAKKEFKPTNLYAKNLVEHPQNAVVVGGKTGTTDEAGYCLILLDYDSVNRPYVSIVMGAPTKARLYHDMTAMIEAIPQ